MRRDTHKDTSSVGDEKYGVGERGEARETKNG